VQRGGAARAVDPAAGPIALVAERRQAGAAAPTAMICTGLLTGVEPTGDRLGGFRPSLTSDQPPMPRRRSRRTAFELLAFPAVGLSRLSSVWPQVGGIEPAIAAQLEVDARYASYVDRQAVDVLAFRKEESVRIPADFAYVAVAGLSTEVRQKLEALRPATLAQAARMEGMTPAAYTSV